MSVAFCNQVSQSAFCAPIPTPGLTAPMRDWCERFYWAILRSWAKNKEEIRKTSCVFSVQSNGDISNVRTLQSSGSDEMDQTAVRVLKQASPLPDFSFTGHPLIPFKVLPEIIVHFDRYPVLSLTMEDSGYSTYAWPPDRGPVGDPLTMSDEQLLGHLFDHTVYLLPVSWVRSQGLNKVSCVFTLSESGEVRNARIFQSSGLPKIDDAALSAISSENPPFEKLLAPLHRSYEIVVEFYQTGDLRIKLKTNDDLKTIGRYGSVPDPFSDCF